MDMNRIEGNGEGLALVLPTRLHPFPCGGDGHGRLRGLHCDDDRADSGNLVDRAVVGLVRDAAGAVD
jgi:hypothetical protein